MKEHMNIHGPAVRPDQLTGIYDARQTALSPWVPITDQVMGGTSTAELRHGERHGSACTCLSGRTRLEHDGGFVQMKLAIGLNCSPGDYAGVFIELCGAPHDYDLSVKSSQLEKPWQSFRCTLSVEPQWTRFIVPYAQLYPHRTEAELEPANIRSVAVLAIGTAFDVDVCVRRFGFYR